jgi:phasin family protein
MPSTDHNTPTTKSGRRSRKAAPRNPKPELPQTPQADQLQAAEQPIDIATAPADAEIVEATTAAAAVEATAGPAETSLAEAVLTMEAPPIEAAATAPIDAGAAPADTAAPSNADAPAEPAPVSLQTIAKAYGDFTRKSLEETRSYVEKLRDVRSLDKAVEVQTEFAKHAFENFVAGSQKIYGLHKELAKQTLKPLERLVDKPTRDKR